jgi:hypothetical protein
MKIVAWISDFHALVRHTLRYHTLTMVSTLLYCTHVMGALSYLKALGFSGRYTNAVQLATHLSSGYQYLT